MKEFLESCGYEPYEEDEFEFGKTVKYAKRINDFTPVCELNEHIAIHIKHTDWRNSFFGVIHNIVEIELAHERKGGEWCNLSIYSLTEDQLKENLNKYENNLLDLWTLFYNQGETK